MGQLKTCVTFGLLTLFVTGETLAATCHVHGDPHVETLDGASFRFTGQPDCDYLLVKHSSFRIFGTFVSCKKTSCLAKVIVQRSMLAYDLGRGNDLSYGFIAMDRNNLTLPFDANGIKINYLGNLITLSIDMTTSGYMDNVTVVWDRHKSVTIDIPDALQNTTVLKGMCGDFDANPDNDEAVFVQNQDTSEYKENCPVEENIYPSR